MILKYLKKIRIRYKLSVLLLVPSIAFLCFTGIVVANLIEDVQTVSWNRDLRQEIAPYSKLNNALTTEANQNLLFIRGKNVNIESAYLATDKALEEIKAFFNSKESLQLTATNAFEGRILQDKAQLTTIRKKIAEKSISQKDMLAFYFNLKRTCSEAITSINQLHKTQKRFTRPNTAFISLLHEEFAFEQLAIAVESILLEKKISIENIRNLVRMDTEEIDSRNAFFDFSTNELKRIYEEIMSDPSLTLVNEMLNEVLDGNVNISFDEWQIHTTHKSTLLRQTIKAISTFLQEDSKSYLTNITTKLVITLIIAIGLIIFIWILGHCIIRDISEALKSLTGFSQQLASKNLMNLSQKSERGDEIGELEEAFLTMGSVLIQIIHQLRKEAQSIADSTNEFVSAVSELSTEQKETESAVVETNTAMEELRKSSEQTNKSASEMKSISSQTQEAINSGYSATQNTIENLNVIKEKMGVVSDSTRKLSDHCQAIDSIVDSVHDLAEQSHVLAVNAAIEAAKAGEHGKGFAIVAAEVRNLAEQSKQATAKVHDILYDIQNAMNDTVLATEQSNSAVTKGVELSLVTSEQMQKLIDTIGVVVSSSDQISKATEQQFTAVDQTTEALQNIKQASSEQTALGGSLSENIGKLHSITQALIAIMQEFQVDENRTAPEVSQ